MKKLLVLILVIAGVALGLTSCGSWGVDGRVFLALNWDYVLYADLSGTGLPTVVNEWEYYLVSPGSYSFNYYLYNSSVGNSATYTASYTVEEDPAGVGLFPGMAGSDGVDNYYDLYLGWWNTVQLSGPTNSQVTPLNLVDPSAGSTATIRANGKIVTVTVKPAVNPSGNMILQQSK